jgi:ABC-type oligopeptide transport system substrate-binding subunit/DNA-binding SARP family transcriptional activator
MSSLALFLLGPPRVEFDGAPIEIDRRKAVALIAYLAVTGYEHGRDTLATLLWPDYDQTRARGALRRTLSVLNRALGGAWLAVDRETIALKRTPNLWIDVEQFRQQLTACQEHNHAPTDLCVDCLSSLTQAVALYHDDFLAGFTLRDSPSFDEWQFFQAENLRRELAGILERLVRYHCAQEEYEPAITYARRWLELDVLHEPVHQHLIQLYAWTDQRAAALRQYQECVRLFEEELGVSPSKETFNLYEQIRTGSLNRKTGALANIHEKKAELFSPTPLHHRFLAPPDPPSFLTSPPPYSIISTPFVAREDELTQMRRYLESMLIGQGQVIFITGEAGSGKTVLVHEFIRRAQEISTNLVVASGNCNAHTGSGDPYLPFREILSLLTGDIELKWNQGMLTQESANRLWALLPISVQALVDFGPDLINTFIPGAALTSRASGLASSLGQLEQTNQRHSGGNGAGNVAQSDLFEQYTNVLQALARQQPLLLVVDDAQWADVASINLLFHLGRRLGSHRILMLITYRSDDVALGRDGERHPLEAVVNELKRIYGNTEVNLDQSMDRHFVEAFLDTQTNRLGQGFRTSLYHQTQGHPLFTVELLWDMQQRGDLVHDEQGRWVEGPTLNWKTLPARIEAVIKERLDRLDQNLRDILAVASVEGERFTAQVIAQVQDIGERQLLRALSQELEKRHRLVRSHGEIEIGDRFLSRYRFNHTLFQQYLYNNLSPGERRLLHGEIAATLEEFYADQTDKITVRLARHYVEAGQTDKAVDYLLQAGDRARNLYANREAIDFYQQALTSLREQRAYERAARTLMKLGLTHHLTFDFQHARQAFEEGFALWQQAGTRQPASLPPAPHPLRMIGNEPATLDSTMAMDEGSVTIINKLFRGLVDLHPDMEVVPDIAQSWEVLENGCKYIFHLRDDARWSDGTAVTAEDFVYAWQRVLDPGIASPNASLLYDVKNAEAFHQGEISNPDQLGVYAFNPTTLAVELEAPTSYFPHLLTYTPTYPVPRHAIEKYGQTWTNVENLVNNGPFRLETYQPRQLMTFGRNPEYQGRFTGNVELVELYLSVKTSGRVELCLEQYEADKLDVTSIWHLTASEMDRVRRQYADEYLSIPCLATHYIGFDVTRPPFDDVRVRRAFAMAVDKETLADVVLGGYVFPATGGFVPPGMPGHSAGIGLPYNPDQARQLLAEAGYPKGRGFPTVEWLINHGHAYVREYLQTQWQENLNIDLTGEECSKDPQFFDRLGKNPPHMFRMGWSADYPDPDNILRASCILPLRHWQNNTFAGLIEQARRVTDQPRRIELYQQADKILVDEAPIMPYLYVRHHFLVKPWVTRYPTSPIRTAYWEDIIIEPH